MMNSKLRRCTPKTLGLVLLAWASACSDAGDVTETGSGGTSSGESGAGGTAAGASGQAGTGGGGGNSGNGASGGSSGSGGSEASTVPTVTSNNPADGATGVSLNGSISARFSEAMDTDTLSVTTFTLTSGTPAVPIVGRVVVSSAKAAFWPSAPLASNVEHTAMITTGAQSAAGIGLAASHSWQFTTGDSAAAGLPVDLGTAGDYAILAKAAISTVPTSAVTGDIGVSPAAATYVTGFELTADATNVFATSDQVTGNVYAADYEVPTPSNMTTAISDMEFAFVDAAGRAPDVTELGAGTLSGSTLTAGVYQWGTGLLIPTDLSLTGSATDVWIFQVAQDLTMSNGTSVLLTGGALPKNVFWQVSGQVDLGTTVHFEGVVLSQTAITLGTGASVEGRLLAQTAVILRSSTVVEPAE